MLDKRGIAPEKTGGVGFGGSRGRRGQSGEEGVEMISRLLSM
jgi:hypothetical protein